MRLRRLPIGRAWEALREDEIACRSLGINTTNTKLTAFAIGAMFGGFAGSFFAARQGFISRELHLHGIGDDPRHRRARRHGQPDRRRIAAVVMIGGTELLRDLDFLKAIFGPTSIRPVPHAAVRPRHGADHGLAAARPDLHARADVFLRKPVAANSSRRGHG
jgi:branched-chain amino acid transport system permease protein